MTPVGDIAWSPTPEYVENANVTRLMREHGIANIDELRARSTQDIGWYWDAETYGSLLAQDGGREPVRTYVEQHRPHLLRAYAMDCLVNAIETMRRDRVRVAAR